MNTYNNTSNAVIEYYTLDQAREILREEARQKRLARQKREAKRKARQRERFLYYLKQKSIGLLSIGLAILTPILLDGDATASLIFLPVGLWLLFTKERVMNF